MAEAAPNFQQHDEFWKPVAVSRVETPKAEAAAQTCLRCGADLVLGAHFCYSCGEQTDSVPVRTMWVAQWLDFLSVCRRLNQTVASFVALVLGTACLVAGLFTGLVFTAATLSDWQAIQLWRIEWLLAAIALFAAGILLKHTGGRKS